MPTEITPPNPSGLCQCGCGQQAPLAKQTDSKRGLCAGKPRLYIKGHHWEGYRRSLGQPNPSGLCGCGCGRPTALSKYTSTVDQTVRGLPVRFLPGHQCFKYQHAPEGHRWCRHCEAFLPANQFYGKVSAASGMCKTHHRQYNRTPDRQESQKNKRLRQYRLTVEDYAEMLSEQKGLCAICLQPESRRHQNGNLKQLAVDHNHLTGKVRALLCQGCNQGIGLLEDDIPRLQSAIRYLKKHR